MEAKHGCAHCIGYLIREGLTEPSECWDCHQIAWNWVQYPGGTYGGKCTACGMSVAADLNTECELDKEQYVITIPPQPLTNTTLVSFSKVVNMNALQTRKTLENGSIVLSGKLDYTWDMISKLAGLGVKFSITPDDLKERYFYAGRCEYPYAIV